MTPERRARTVWTENAGYVFEDRTTKHNIRVGEGQSMVAFMKDQPPERFPLDEPGLYEVDLAWAAADAQFPIIIAVVPNIEADMLTGGGKLTSQQRRWLKSHACKAQ